MHTQGGNGNFHQALRLHVVPAALLLSFDQDGKAGVRSLVGSRINAIHVHIPRVAILLGGDALNDKLIRINKKMIDLI